MEIKVSHLRDDGGYTVRTLHDLVERFVDKGDQAGELESLRGMVQQQTKLIAHILEKVSYLPKEDTLKLLAEWDEELTEYTGR